MLRIVLPKGSLEAATLKLFEDADLPVRRTSDREYHGTIDDPRVTGVSVLRPQEIPQYVQEGYFDLGITGQDAIAETESDVVELAEFHFSKATARPVRIVLAVQEASGILTPKDLPEGIRVSTEMPGITKRYFERHGIKAVVHFSHGATEAKVGEGIVDAVVERTETGSSLRRNNLRVIDTLLESWTVLVANRESHADPAKRKAMDELQLLLDGALRARGRVLVKLNVPAGQLEAVLDVLPAMKAPTVSQLSTGNDYAVETVADKSTINVLIPELKARGATDIVELPLSKIVP